MRKLTLLVPVAALAFAGTAVSAQQRAPQGDMTRAQMQARAEAGFARLDANKDGKIDQADREARRASAFDRIDTDNNGQISREEMAAAQAKRGDRQARRGDGRRGMKAMRGMRRGADDNAALTQTAFVERALTRFDRVDANNDGTVTAAERQAARAAMRDRMQARRDARQQG